MKQLKHAFTLLPAQVFRSTHLKTQDKAHFNAILFPSNCNLTVDKVEMLKHQGTSAADTNMISWCGEIEIPPWMR